MTYELTKDGLFSYFDPVAIEKMIEFSLIRRNLSVHQYALCKEACFLSKNAKPYVYKKTGDLDQAVVNFSALQEASVVEIKQYFSMDKVRDIYIRKYGELFKQFENKVLSTDETLSLNYWDFLPFFDREHEKKLILQIQSVMSLTLQNFTSTVLEQDALLKSISLDLVCQARKAQLFIAAVRKDDAKFKKSVMKIGFSVVKLGFSFFHADQLVNIGEALSDLASSAADKVDESFDTLVSKIEELLVQTHIQSIQNAELKLLTTLSRDMETGLLTVVKPQQIEIYWEKYRLFILFNCMESMKQVLQKYVYCDDFFRCVIKQTAYQHQQLTYDGLLVYATEKAQQHLQKIFSALDNQIKNITRIRDAVASPYGSRLIEDYFKKVCLIQYTLEHENTGSFLKNWITKKLGHRLSFYFPDLVFQKKWSPACLNRILHRKIKYCKQEMTVAEYKERRRNSTVVLGLFRHSFKARQELFASLEYIMPGLNDELIKELQHANPSIETEIEWMPEECGTLRSFRYSFSRRNLSLFTFNEPDNDEGRIKSIPATSSPRSIVSKRWVSVQHNTVFDS